MRSVRTSRAGTWIAAHRRVRFGPKRWPACVSHTHGSNARFARTLATSPPLGALPIPQALHILWTCPTKRDPDGVLQAAGAHSAVDCAIAEVLFPSSGLATMLDRGILTEPVCRGASPALRSATVRTSSGRDRTGHATGAPHPRCSAATAAAARRLWARVLSSPRRESGATTIGYRAAQRPQRDLNPRYRLERAGSWAG